jgi:methylenetetrahydrofolate--tRNA-(uracil-5-)-methyltransferase
VTERVRAHPRITIEARIVESLPIASELCPVLIATGPLTGEALTADIVRIVGAAHLSYYDAIAPIVSAESIDWDKVFRQSRWGKGAPEESFRDETALGDQAYVNCPFGEAGYLAFVQALLDAPKVQPRAFEDVRYFEGCLPVEVMASRGPLTLAFGPMKPVGLSDPRTGRRPFAVVQLRPEDEAMTAYNLVGFQTRMTYGAQSRVFGLVPGLEHCDIQRYGSVHRNTFLDAPALLDERMQLHARPNVFFAGQITGVEGYVESCASGLVCAIMLAQAMRGETIHPPPPNTALGGILTHLQRKQPSYQPSNITWACLPPHENPRLKKRDRYVALADRALDALTTWLDAIQVRPAPG